MVSWLPEEGIRLHLRGAQHNLVRFMLDDACLMLGASSHEFVNR